MSTQFFHIASVLFSHESYGTDEYDGFSWFLDQESFRLSKNLNLIFKSIPGGIAVLSSDPQMLENENSFISLNLFPKNPLFYNFTYFGFDFRPDSRVFFFEISSKDENSNYLHKEDFVSFHDGLTVFRSALKEDFLRLIQNGDLILFDINGQAIPENQILSFFEDPEVVVFFTEQDKERKGYFKPSGGMDKTPFGIIQLKVSGFLEKFNQSGKPELFQIKFKSRKTIWKYILSDKIYDKFERLKIVDPQNQELRFKESSFEINPTWVVRSFESEEAMPFLVNVMPRFQLVEESLEGQITKVISKQLPKASPESLSLNPHNEQILITNIFI